MQSRYHFYPRSPCGERQPATSRNNKNNMISIHALLAESDADSLTDDVTTGGFLSTLSLRRATALAPEENPAQKNFYPRSPCGERHDFEPSTTRKLTFLSTLSLRRATSQRRRPDSPGAISIHALLAESDWPGLLARPFFIISIHALLAESDDRKISWLDTA